MMIDRCEIERNLPYMEWEQTVRSILFKEKGIKDIDLDRFVSWNLANPSFSLAKYRKCTKKEIDRHTRARPNAITSTAIKSTADGMHAWQWHAATTIMVASELQPPLG